MHKTLEKSKILLLFCFLASTTAFCTAEQLLDKTRYITIDEIKPGMKAYCLTSYKGTNIEKFDLEVLSVVRDVRPGRDAIMVQGTDERFIHSGPVAGCSGSPVYIEGRLAGALAFGWLFSKDPLYGVTPIEEMLRVGQGGSSESGTNSFEPGGFTFDFSVPIDFDEINKQITSPQISGKNNPDYAAYLPSPLITHGLPPAVCEQLNNQFQPFGFMAVSGLSGGNSNKTRHKSGSEKQKAKLAPGASIAVPLVAGDIKIEAIGAVTEVIGNKVYGFGHSLLGYGPIDLPMATSEVHTVVSSVYRSFKFASSLEIVGALRQDESAAILGYIGQKPRMIPLTIKIEHYNDPEKRLYNCQLASNRLFTPLVLNYAIAGAVLSYGALPPNHMIEYKVNINVEDAEPITFENVSTSLKLEEMTKESIGSVAILLNNPYKKVNIKSIDFDIHIVPKNIISHIWSVDLSDSEVKAGQTINIDATIESVLADKKKYSYTLKIPHDLEPGKYDLIVCGGYQFRNFLRKTVPYRFIPQNLTTLIEIVNNILAIKRDRLYFLLVLPPSGLAIEKTELPDLPATKAMILQDNKRTLRTQPYMRWIQDSLETGTVIIDKKNMQITVEK